MTIGFGWLKAAVWGAIGLGLICVSCTTLGPMPATTGVGAVPAGRPSGEISVGAVPGYYLSTGAQQSPEGAALNQASVLLEPDRLVKVPGLVVGARYIGKAENGGYFEPLAGYRLALDDNGRFAAVGVGYFTHASGSLDRASYRATRGGAEVGFDVRATPTTKWVEVHANASLALTGLSASGQYCLDAANEYGQSCPDPATNVTTVHVSGIYPSATVGVSLDFARHLETFFHGGRLVLGASGGTLPTAIGGRQTDAHWYGAAGGTLTLAFGSPRS